jgi:hypothetical protein
MARFKPRELLLGTVSCIINFAKLCRQFQQFIDLKKKNEDTFSNLRPWVEVATKKWDIL